MADHLLPPLTEDMKARFWAKVDICGPDDCWHWTAATNKGGYGVINLRQGRGPSTFLATHLALTIAGLPRPSGFFALHSCDVRRCVNPQHLRWGTKQDNADDMVRRRRTHPAEKRSATMMSRAARGERHPCAILTEDIVRAIRKDSRSCAEIGRELGLSQRAIWDARTGKTWRHC